MRTAALLAALLLVASCSTPQTPPPLQDGPTKSGPSASSAPAAIAPTATPDPASSTNVVPAIDYPRTGGNTEPGGKPDAVGGATPDDAPSSVPSNGGDPSLGTSPPPSPSPAAPIEQAPSEIRTVLDHQMVSLPGGVKNLSSASSPKVLVYQYGTDPDKLSASAPGCLRIGIKVESAPLDNFKPVQVTAATVTYTQVDGSGRRTWVGNYLPGNGSSQLMLDATATGGKLTFQVKGILISDGGGGFGMGGGGANQVQIDWTMKDLSVAIPTPPSADPGASPTPTPTGNGWTHL